MVSIRSEVSEGKPAQSGGAAAIAPTTLTSEWFGDRHGLVHVVGCCLSGRVIRRARRIAPDAGAARSSTAVRPRAVPRSPGRYGAGAGGAGALDLLWRDSAVHRMEYRSVTDR